MRATPLQSSLFLLLVVFLLALSPLVQVGGRQINKYDGSNGVPATETRAREGVAGALTWYARRPRHPSPPTKKRTKKRGIAAHHDPEVVRIVGSRLPDCSHACGQCSPCRLVMISFVCASLEEAESCPMAYKCMCNSKSYPVP